MNTLVLLGLAALLYAGSALLYIWFVATRRLVLGQWADYPLMAGWALQSLALLMRWTEASRPPVTNIFEFIAFYTWLLVLVFLVVERAFSQRVLGAFVMPLTVLLIGVARQWSWPARSSAT